MRKNLEISVRVKNIPRHATTMALSASGTKRDKTKKDTKRTCRKHQKIIDKERMNKLPRDIILMIAKMHPLIIPPFTNKTLHRAVKDYLAGGDRKKRIVEYSDRILTSTSRQIKKSRGSHSDSDFFHLNLSLNRKSPIHQTKKSRPGHSDSDSSWYQGA